MQQTTVVQVGGEKNVGVATVLALFFGPLGMLYSTVGGAITMLVVNGVIIFSIGPLAALVTIPISTFWVAKAAGWHNEELEEAAQALARGSGTAKACRSCGGQMGADGRFCPNCGTARENASG